MEMLSHSDLRIVDFAAYLLPFKRRLPVPVLERVYQDIAQKRYVVGEGAATPARRKGKKSAADDDSADNGASRKRTTVAIDQDDDDDNAPPTPPRANSNS
jgi:hypothetical protein